MGSEGIPGNISKGPGHLAIDLQLNYQEDGKYVRRPEIREALADTSNSYIDLMRTLFFVPESIVRYVNRHWIPDDITQPEVWWRDKQPVEPLFRYSTIEAIDLAGICLSIRIGCRLEDGRSAVMTYRMESTIPLIFLLR